LTKLLQKYNGPFLSHTTDWFPTTSLFPIQMEIKPGGRTQRHKVATRYPAVEQRSTDLQTLQQTSFRYTPYWLMTRALCEVADFGTSNHTIHQYAI